MLSAAKWGALVGVAIYLVAQVLLLITQAAFPGAVDVNNPGAVSLGCLSLLLLLFAFSTSGFYSGRETGVAGLGAVAGMITFVVYDALTAIYSIGGHGAQTTTRGGALGAVVVAIIAFLLYIGLAALIGWLGGRPGAARAKRRLPALAGDPGGIAADAATEAPTESEPGAR
ncbi:MAG TPA: hypothetical protein VMV29_13260 [Ktedonobacterales bacterium]|nr:hypothetical protein [Ktedonobacterales bacterium]